MKSSATPESRAAYLANLRKQIEALGLVDQTETDPQTGKPRLVDPTMEKPEGSSPEAAAPVPSADKPGFEGDGGYVYDVDDKTKTIKILKSPRSAGGQSVAPGSPTYAAIAKELNDKYQLGLDVPAPKPEGFKMPPSMGTEPPSEAGRMPGRSTPASDWKPPMPVQPPLPAFGNMANKDKDSPPSLMDNAAATMDKVTSLRLPDPKPLETGLQPNNVQLPIAKAAQIQGAMGTPPLAPQLAASMKRLGFPGDAVQGITPELVNWLSTLPDAEMYKPEQSPGNALEMIKAIASSSTGVTSKDYGRPNGQPIM